MTTLCAGHPLLTSQATQFALVDKKAGNLFAGLHICHHHISKTQLMMGTSGDLRWRMRKRQKVCELGLPIHICFSFDLCTKKLGPRSCSHCCSTADAATIYCLVVQTISLNTTQEGLVPNSTEDGCNATACPEVIT